jgi:hypothetical protein
MKISELMQTLLRLQSSHGDLDVMFIDPNTFEPSAITGGEVGVAEKGEFPRSYKMPAGFTYVRLT